MDSASRLAPSVSRLEAENWLKRPLKQIPILSELGIFVCPVRPVDCYNTYMKIINNLLSSITMYQAVLYSMRMLMVVATILTVFGYIDYPWWYIPGNFVLFALFCLGTNFFFSKLVGVKPNYESQYITAEILTMIVGPLNPITNWWVILVISFIAMAGKYVFVYNKKHVFNPAALGVLGSALLIEQGASWWVGGQYMLPFVILGGLFVAQKLRWFHLVISFLLTYFIALSLSLLWQGQGFSVILPALQSTVLYSAVIFFATVMLVEPLTAPRTRMNRIFYGTGIAILMVGMPIFFPNYGYSIETALLIGNVGAFLSSLNSGRQTLKFVKKELVAKDTYSLWFEPFKKFDFIPGQFLEWTLAHEKNDSRGVRRFFTIASSPTEPLIRLVTKDNAKPSTFKKALLNLNRGDEIVVSGLEGDFVLPSKDDKFVFIAGGVGITPYLSITKYLLDSKIKKNIVLLLANKTPDEIAFQEEFKAVEQIGLKTINVVTEDPTSNWTGPKGFITKEIIEQNIPDYADRLFYISGPEPMVMAYEKMLSKMGVSKNRVKRDYFPGYKAE